MNNSQGKQFNIWALFTLMPKILFVSQKIDQLEAIPNADDFFHLPKFFVRRQNLLFLDSYPSSGHLISRTWPFSLIDVSGYMKNFTFLDANNVSKTKYWWWQNVQIWCKRQTLFIVVGTYYIAIYYENKQLRILKKICKNLGSI